LRKISGVALSILYTVFVVELVGVSKAQRQKKSQGQKYCEFHINLPVDLVCLCSVEYRKMTDCAIWISSNAVRWAVQEKIIS
jgi:hypothetical protein